MQGLTSIYVIIRRIIRCTSWWFQFKSLSDLNSSSLLSPMASLSIMFPMHVLKGFIHPLPPRHAQDIVQTSWQLMQPYLPPRHILSDTHTPTAHKIQNGVRFIGHTFCHEEPVDTLQCAIPLCQLMMSPEHALFKGLCGWWESAQFGDHCWPSHSY